MRELPYRASEPVGEQALREVADALYGDGDPAASRAGRRELLRVDADGTDFVLQMQLPLAVKSGVDVARAGDDLIVTVSGHRRVLTCRACCAAAMWSPATSTVRCCRYGSVPIPTCGRRRRRCRAWLTRAGLR